MYRIVYHTWREVFDDFQEKGIALPDYIKKEFESYLQCGILYFGFGRVYCETCRESKCVAFACLKKGFCPSCAGRRMAEQAAHLVDYVFENHIPLRQFVLSMPIQIRLIMAQRPDITTKTLAIFIKHISRYYRFKAKEIGIVNSIAEAKCGAVTSIQRHGSALNLNTHFHSLVPNGVFVEKGTDSESQVQFIGVPGPKQTDLDKISNEVCKDVKNMLSDMGLWEDLPADEHKSLSICYEESIYGRLKVGPNKGEQIVRIGATSAITRAHFTDYRGSLFDINASRVVPAFDPQAREQLAQYILRPAISNKRVILRDDGQVEIVLKRAYSDGTSSLLMTPHEFIRRLIAQIPKPYSNALRFHGAYAPNSKIRKEIVPDKPAKECTHDTKGSGDGERTNEQLKQRADWAYLLKRTFNVDVLDVNYNST